MHLTVAICTWNRAELLEVTLSHMVSLVVPEQATWELLVVDNNSTDRTEAVVDSFVGRLPVRRVFEGTAGKSHALNRAAGEATGDYIIWTDDDVLVSSSWLVAYVDAFERHPGAGFFGGAIRPWFPNQPPDWLRRAMDNVSSAFATLDYGSQEFVFTAERVPFGANMAVRAAEQRAFLYDVALGPRPGSSVRGEETAMIRRMIASGIEGWWVPGASVRHHVPPERQSLRYVRSYYTGYGQQLALLDDGAPTALLFGKPRWLWRCAVESEVGFWLGRIHGKPERWVSKLREASIAWGRLGFASLWSRQR